MLALDDPRWDELKAGYRILYDPRPALRQLESGHEVAAAWDELWNELHHQGDVGEASYAAVPHLVRIQEQKHSLDWNLYALVSTIETERHYADNPPIPVWLIDSYREAWRTLVELAINDLKAASDETTLQALLAAIALGKRQFDLGCMILETTKDERREFLAETSGKSNFDSW